MNRELVTYFRLQAVIAAAFNFFIGGMIAALIHHKADFVSTNTISIVIDITITCLLTFSITTPFCRASLRRDKTGGVLVASSPPARLMAWFSHRPLLLIVSLGLCTALFLSVLTASVFTLLDVYSLSFYIYIVLKSLFSSGLGAFATCAVLYTGMHRTE